MESLYSYGNIFCFLSGTKSNSPLQLQLLRNPSQHRSSLLVIVDCQVGVVAVGVVVVVVGPRAWSRIGTLVVQYTIAQAMSTRTHNNKLLPIAIASTIGIYHHRPEPIEEKDDDETSTTNNREVQDDNTLRTSRSVVST